MLGLILKPLLIGGAALSAICFLMTVTSVDFSSFENSGDYVSKSNLYGSNDDKSVNTMEPKFKLVLFRNVTIPISSSSASPENLDDEEKDGVFSMPYFIKLPTTAAPDNVSQAQPTTTTTASTTTVNPASSIDNNMSRNSMETIKVSLNSAKTLSANEENLEEQSTAAPNERSASPLNYSLYYLPPMLDEPEADSEDFDVSTTPSTNHQLPNQSQSTEVEIPSLVYLPPAL